MTTDIQQWRSAICEQLIKAGLTDSKNIVSEASNIEVYVFGEKASDASKPEIKKAEVKTSNPLKSQAAKDATAAAVDAEQKIAEAKTADVAEEVTQTESVEPPTTTITKKEVTDACMAVAKKDRSKLLKILEKGL